ncbi:DNA polymerase III subunit beta [Candidatus Aerophobetes bacterium]|nr:DNA polymerase III subunit beta [Candidatus Aerophobetes bacterium]
MRIVCEKDKALEAVRIAQNAITSTTLPILSHLLLSTDEGRVEVVGTNLETTIGSFFEATVEEQGNICLPGNRFYSILRELPPGELYLEVAQDKCKIKMGEISFTLLGISSEDFPEVPSKLKTACSLSQVSLQEILTKTMFAAGQDEVRQSLNCILLESSSEDQTEGHPFLRAVATDGRRLSSLAIPQSSISTSFKVLLPLKAARQLIKILSGQENVEMGLGESRVSFTTSEFSFFSQLIDANFPDYRGVIPRDYKVSFEIERGIFTDAVKRVSILSDEQTRLVKFKLEDDTLNIAATSAEIGSAQERLPVKIEGERYQIEIGFNALFLLEALRVMEGETVKVHLIDQESPGAFYPKSPYNHIYILMPVKLREE